MRGTDSLRRAARSALNVRTPSTLGGPVAHRPHSVDGTSDAMSTPGKSDIDRIRQALGPSALDDLLARPEAVEQALALLDWHENRASTASAERVLNNPQLLAALIEGDAREVIRAVLETTNDDGQDRLRDLRSQVADAEAAKDVYRRVRDLSIADADAMGLERVLTLLQSTPLTITRDGETVGRLWSGDDWDAIHQGHVALAASTLQSLSRILGRLSPAELMSVLGTPLIQLPWGQDGAG